MALTVGTDSYISLEDADAYFEARWDSTAWDAATDPLKEACLRICATIIDNMYEWYGTATDEDQLLAWPRDGVYSPQGALLDKDTIPTFIKNAQCELAYQWVQADQLTPSGTSFTAEDEDASRGGVRRLRLGKMEKEYHYNPTGFLFADSSRGAVKKLYPLVDLLVRPYSSGKSDSLFRHIMA